MYKRSYIKLKPELLEKFNHQCAYCGTKIFEPMMADIEHFYPKSLYPDLALDSDNMLISCRPCNILKSNKFPLDEEGEPLLINPAKEKFSEHMIQLDNGYLEAKTERGKITIDTLQLNRKALINQRVLDMIDMEFDNDIDLSSDGIYETFNNGIQYIKELNLLELKDENHLKQYMKFMLYGNVITILETYLCDRFIFLVNSDEKYLRTFVETFKDFKYKKISINNVFKEYDGIKDEVNKALRDILYHNLEKVWGIYNATLKIKFPEPSEFQEVYESIKIRHDIVHRSGKTKEGNFHDINEDVITQLIKSCTEFVSSLEEELKQVE